MSLEEGGERNMRAQGSFLTLYNAASASFH